MILVTGGTGLVGSHLLYHLSLENDIVKATYRKNSDLNAVKSVFAYYTSNFEILFNKIEWIEADITDVFSLEMAFNNVTKVYHAAAFISFNPRDYKLMRKVNIEGTANVVNLCIEKSIEKLCFVSSVASIDKSRNSKIIDENNEWNFENSNYGYAITKYGSEMEVWRASQEGIDVIIVNPGVILGSGFWKNGPGAIFDKIYKGLNFYSEGITAYVSVEDVVKVMVLLMNGNIKNERYILVSENLSFRTVFNKIADSIGKKRPSIKVTKLMSEFMWRFESVKTFILNKPPILTKHSSKSIHNKFMYSSEKVKNDLNYTFESIDTCIERVCKQYLKKLMK